MDTVPMTTYAKTEDGLQVAFQVVGDGPLDLLWFSGGLIPIDIMDEEPRLARFQRRLGSFSRLVRFDPRGAGLSDPISLSTPPTLEQWAHDARAVMDAVGSERTAVFAPAPAAMEAVVFAATYPDRVAALVVVNGMARMLWAPDFPLGVSREFMDTFRRVNTEPDAVERGFDILPVVAPSAAHDPSFRNWWVRAGNRAASPAMARAIMQVRQDADVRPALPLIQAPTLVLHRQDNRFIVVGHGRYLTEHIPGAKYVELPGADNVPWIGDTTVMLDEIEEFLTGVRHQAEPDRVLATVLFSDIVDSTAQASTMGDRAWHDRLDAHDAMVRRQLDRFRGREIKATGDGFLATFDGPARAIQCGGAIRDGARQMGIEVRVGLHTGEIDLRGADVGGVTVNIGARVAAQAGPGDVLVSRTVVDLVAGSRLTFEDRGEHELKGVPGTWRLFAIVE